MGTAGTAGKQRPAREELPSDRLLELATATLLALASMASAWCAYQSSRWDGTQSFRLNDADGAGRKATELSLLANHDRLLDTVTFMRFMTALEQDNKNLQQLYLNRFRPEMRTAVDAWLATGPMKNPDAPADPFNMPQYRVGLEEQAAHARETADYFRQEAVKAKHISEQYTLMTVMLASVFLFAGIATHFVWPRIKVLVFVMGILTFFGILLWLARWPRAP
jgi:hypothetical protein